jgi:hypothetical protein
MWFAISSRQQVPLNVDVLALSRLVPSHYLKLPPKIANPFCVKMQTGRKK